MTDGFDHIHPLDPGRKPRGYWTYARCLRAASECGATSSTHWEGLHPSSSTAASRLKVIRKIATKLGWKSRLPDGYWTRETCEKSARDSGECSLSKWQQKDSSGYAYAMRNGWARGIAKELGWKILTPEGYWNYSTCLERAIECGASNTSEWRDKCSGSQAAAYQLGVVGKIAKKLGWRANEKRGYWTYAKCRDSAKGSGAETIAEWRRKHHKSYIAAGKQGWPRKIALELGWEIRALPGQRTFEDCIKNARSSNVKNIGEWQRSNGNLYYVAWKFGWTKKISDSMGWDSLAERGSYTYEFCLNAANNSGAKTISEWRKLDSTSYSAAARTPGWTRMVAEALGWSVRVTRPAGYWDPKTIRKDARKSQAKSLSHWARTKGSGYNAACALGIQVKIAEEMGWKIHQHGNAKIAAVVYWYFDGEYVYIGETGNPDARFNSHFLSQSTSIVYDYIDLDIEPEYIMRAGGDALRYMAPQLAKRVERRMIKCAVSTGYKVLNKMHNPQWNGTTFSWEEEPRKVLRA